MTTPDRSTRLPGAAIAADGLAAILIVIGTIVELTGPIRFALDNLPFSVSTASRSYLLAAIVLAVRHWRVPDHPILTRVVRWLRDPQDMGERRLFVDPQSFWRRVGGLALVTLGFSAIVAAATWPQIRHPDWVPDPGDPLFSVWRIAWVAHQLSYDPLHLFDGNIFYPERLTLTYSDPVLVPAIMSAPFFWLGVHPLTVYTLLFLSGFVVSGVTMFLLVRALTGRRDAAAIAGAVFALYSFRFDHYSHLELQMTMWMPLALWGLHRTMALGRLRDGIGTGVAFALQTLSSLYYGVFFAIYLIPIGATLWLARRRPRRPLWALAAGAVLTGAIVAPVAAEYLANTPVLGERPSWAIAYYSATASDYLRPQFRSRWYTWPGPGHAERDIFPGVAPVVLAGAALWPPLSAARIAYALALAVAVDGSLGLNGAVYPWLHDLVWTFRGLRVPARFAMFVGLTLAILSGYGAARLLERWQRWRIPLTALMLAVVIVEPWPSLKLEPVWQQPPAVYNSVPESAVLAEFPMPADWTGSWFDTRYMYFSTFRWHKLVNGNSGFYPPSYYKLLEGVRDFPSETALTYLRSRGVDYVAVHGAFYDPEDFRRVIQTLDTRSDLMLAATDRWQGGESRLYQLRR